MADSSALGAPTPAGSGTGALNRFFKISERGSTLSREVRGGLVTFFTMAYIVVLNPIIIGGEHNTDANGHFLQLDQVAAVTALVAGVMSIIFGIVAQYGVAGCGVPQDIVGIQIAVHDALRVQMFGR